VAQENRGRTKFVDFPEPSQEEIRKIITDANQAELLVRHAREIGKSLKEQDLKTSQIRAIFGEVRRIEGDWKIRRDRANRSLILLKPKMAYRAKKEETSYNKSVKNLVSVLEKAIDEVNQNDGNFERFVQFFEAILAYHKAYGGN